ncbi:MAG: hypothetical protein AB1938_25080 [Myxococcota bacterium]
MRPALLLTGLMLVPACQSQPADSPKAAYQAFAVAIRRGDTKAAYASLSKSSRELIEARSKQLVTASQGLLKDEPALMLFQSGTRPAPLSEVKVVEESATSAVLEVSGSRVKMIKEDGGKWVVDLTHLLAEKKQAQEPPQGTP